MHAGSFKVSLKTLWYIVWSILLILAAGDTLAWYPLFASSAGILFSTVIAGSGVFMLIAQRHVMTPKLRRTGIAVLMLFGMSQAISWGSTFSSGPVPRGFDFAAYYVAAQLVAEEPRQSPYLQAVDPDGHIVLSTNPHLFPGWQTPAYRYHVPYAVPFIYPPLIAVLMKPLTRLSFHSAYLCWNVLCVLALWVSVLLTLDFGEMRLSPRLLLILGVGVFSYYPFQSDLLFGQVGCFILFFLTLSMWLLARKHIGFSAFSFALATAVKLTPFLAVPVLMFYRKWAWLSAYVVALLSLVAFSIWQGGWAINRAFAMEVLPSLSCGSPISLNCSITATVQQLFLGYVPRADALVPHMPRYACSVARGVAAGVYGMILFRLWIRRREGDLIESLVLVFLLAVSVSPLSWWNHYTVALLPFVYLWCRLREGEGAMLAALVLVVGTNVVGFAELLTLNPVAQIALSAIVPLLTIAFVYSYSGKGRGATWGPATSVLVAE